MTVQPGGVRTEMAAHSGEISLSRAAELSDHHRDLYAELIAPSLSSQASFLRKAMPADKAAAKIAKIATASRPRALGRDAAIVIPLARVLPARALDTILAASRRSGRARCASA